MLIAGFPAGAFGTNCYVVAAGPDSDAVIIDPGQDASQGVRTALSEYRLNPIAIVLTHGHLDHTWSAQPLADQYQVPVYIHEKDRPMLADPGIGIGPALAQMIGDETFVEPEKVLDLVDGEDLELGGVRFAVSHAPGHTQGSAVLYVEFPDHGSDEPSGLVFSGDVLFAGSVGRSDLPGGNHEQLIQSIKDTLLTRPDDTVVLPGHGPQTSIGAERANNPFL